MGDETSLIGIRNGWKVDNHLYRGGDVSLAGISTLRQLGIAKVISFMNKKQDSPAQILFEHTHILNAGMQWVNVPMESGGFFSYDDISKVPGVLAEIAGTTGPVLCHCHEGKDRSSVVASMYRITHGWTVDDAIKEGQQYGWHWRNGGMRRAVRQWAKEQGYK